MKMQLLSATTAMALFLAFGTAPAALAQNGEPLTKKEAEKLLKQSEQSLKEAQRASKRGEVGQAAEHSVRYTETMDRLNSGLSASNMDNGMNDLEALDVAERVGEATLKHESTLLEVLERVPDQAKPAIERALEASLRGHETATEMVLNRGQVNLSEGVLTERGARDAMKKNEALLKHAERAQKRGDNAAVSRSVDQYAENMGSINLAIEQGRIDSSAAVSVLERVDWDTQRHISKLEGLKDDAPEQALAGIDRSLEESARGHQMATQSLQQRSHAADVITGRRSPGGSFGGFGTRPGTVSGGSSLGGSSMGRSGGQSGGRGR